VIAAGGNRAELESAINPDWGGAKIDGAVTELAQGIASPTVGSVLSGDTTGVEVTRGQLLKP
jgi:hypothetical protein